MKKSLVFAFAVGCVIAFGVEKSKARVIMPTHLQFVYGAAINADERREMNRYTMGEMSYVEHSGYHLPFKTPIGYRIGITQVCISSKMNDRASYLEVSGVYAHPDKVPCTSFETQPLWLTPNAILSGAMINNSGTPQYMIGTIQAILVPLE